jgi:hypothetical protein
MSDKDELLKVLQNLSGGIAPDQQSVSVGKIAAQLQHITGYLHHLEQGIVHMAAEVQRSSLISQLIVNLLISKGLVTPEEFQQMYTDQVFLPMKKTNEAFQEKMQQVQKQQAVQEPDPIPLIVPAAEIRKEEKEEEAEEESTVILASERFKRQQ